MLQTLRDLREQNYISRRELSELSGVSESTITRIEEAKSRVTKRVVEKLLQALSKRIERTITINDIEGLNLYNVMRDRKQRTKAREKDNWQQEASEPAA